MTEPEISARLTALHSALVEKYEGQPYLALELTLDTSGKVRICIWKRDECDVIYTARAETIAATFADAESFVAAMPDPATAKLTACHRKLAEAIDEGHALNLPDDVMTPLRQSSQAMTENLITHAPE